VTTSVQEQQVKRVWAQLESIMERLERVADALETAFPPPSAEPKLTVVKDEERTDA
jgi:hypothetical protein